MQNILSLLVLGYIHYIATILSYGVLTQFSFFFPSKRVWMNVISCELLCLDFNFSVMWGWFILSRCV